MGGSLSTLCENPEQQSQQKDDVQEDVQEEEDSEDVQTVPESPKHHEDSKFSRQQKQNEEKVQQLEQKEQRLMEQLQHVQLQKQQVEQQQQQQLQQHQLQQQQRQQQQSRQQYNILLFGETGSGKSTLINYLTNYFLKGSLSKLKIAIPTKHHPATEGWSYSEKDLHDTTKSKTSECTGYVFKSGAEYYNFIDTPGLSDTEGTAKDDEHITKIMAAAEDGGTLSAIVIVINGTVARATVNLRNTLTLLKGSVPDVLLKNLLVILTNCSKGAANFDLDQLESWKVPKDNVFYMNNSALTLAMEDWKKDKEIMNDVKDHWKKSMKTIEKVMLKVKKLGVMVTSAFKEMRLNRNKIKSELHGILLEVKKLQTLQDELNCAQSAQKDVSTDIEKYSHFKQQKLVDYVELEAADYYSTLCMTHTTACHERCSLTYTTTLGAEIFKRCACMRGTHCKKCECAHSSHYHDMKKPVMKTKTVEDILHDVKALYDQHRGKKTELLDKISSLQTDIESLKVALDAKEVGIRKCCEELKALCTHFNFVDELQSVVDTMKRDARTLTNMKARRDAEARIKNIVHIADQLSANVQNEEEMLE